MSPISENPCAATLYARQRNWRLPMKPPSSLLRMDAFVSMPNHGRGLTLWQRAYAAGIIEGEGAFVVLWINGQRKPTARIAVKMTDEEPVRWLQEAFGGPVAIIPAYGTRKQTWRWYVHGRLAGAVAATVYPFMQSQRRRDAAIRVIRTASISGWLKGPILDERRLALIEKVVSLVRLESR